MTVQGTAGRTADGVRELELRLHDRATRMPLPVLVQALRDLVGGRLTAYLGSAPDTETVKEWTRGRQLPPVGVGERLRLAYRIAALLTEREGTGVAATWLQGINPQLGDQVPARLIRTDPLEVVYTTVLDAARTFVTS